MNGQIHAPVPLPVGKNADTNCIRSLGGPVS